MWLLKLKLKSNLKSKHGTVYMRHGWDHLIEIEDDSEEKESGSEDDGRVPVQVLPPVVGWLIPIKDDEVEETDSEIEEELAIEIATIIA